MAEGQESITPPLILHIAPLPSAGGIFSCCAALRSAETGKREKVRIFLRAITSPFPARPACGRINTGTDGRRAAAADPDKRDSIPFSCSAHYARPFFCPYFVTVFALRRSRPTPINTRACGLFAVTKKVYEKTALFCAVFCISSRIPSRFSPQ